MPVTSWKTFQKYVNRSAEAPCSASNKNHCKILTCHGAKGIDLHHGYDENIQEHFEAINWNREGIGLDRERPHAFIDTLFVSVYFIHQNIFICNQ